MKPSDVALSQGKTPRLDPKRVVRCPVTGAPIAVWQGALVQPQGGKR